MSRPQTVSQHSSRSPALTALSALFGGDDLDVFFRAKHLTVTYFQYLRVLTSSNSLH